MIKVMIKVMIMKPPIKVMIMIRGGSGTWPAPDHDLAHDLDHDEDEKGV